ncbi:hypothetical protein [Actinomadura harenae]|uniref:Uncharacterized protein n=1 Tax=Actinomadura harenae TaxID=2483351 RepID=A0A3M2MDJ1_9ACTN|nr:hypothetical protein [Actinomadura harenae]RMI47784.1 hypothetical protein EBO15_00295 [Actinomadura harenae]
MTDLEHVLAKALTELLVGIDLADDEDIEPETAMRLLEPVATLMEALPAPQQLALANIITSCAEEETDSGRRMTALDLPYAIGIL